MTDKLLFFSEGVNTPQNIYIVTGNLNWKTDKIYHNKKLLSGDESNCGDWCQEIEHPDFSWDNEGITVDPLTS